MELYKDLKPLLHGGGGLNSADRAVVAPFGKIIKGAKMTTEKLICLRVLGTTDTVILSAYVKDSLPMLQQWLNESMASNNVDVRSPVKGYVSTYAYTHSTPITVAGWLYGGPTLANIGHRRRRESAGPRRSPAHAHNHAWVSLPTTVYHH